MTKTHPIGVRLEPHHLEILKRKAADDRRSVSSLVQKIIADWIDALPLADTFTADRNRKRKTNDAAT